MRSTSYQSKVGSVPTNVHSSRQNMVQLDHLSALNYCTISTRYSVGTQSFLAFSRHIRGVRLASTGLNTSGLPLFPQPTLPWLFPVKSQVMVYAYECSHRREDKRPIPWVSVVVLVRAPPILSFYIAPGADFSLSKFMVMSDLRHGPTYSGVHAPSPVTTAHNFPGGHCRLQVRLVSGRRSCLYIRKSIFCFQSCICIGKVVNSTADATAVLPPRRWDSHCCTSLSTDTCSVFTTSKVPRCIVFAPAMQ
jgi:hypothetical protein